MEKPEVVGAVDSFEYNRFADLDRFIAFVTDHFTLLFNVRERPGNRTPHSSGGFLRRPPLLFYTLLTIRFVAFPLYGSRTIST